MAKTKEILHIKGYKNFSVGSKAIWISGKGGGGNHPKNFQPPLPSLKRHFLGGLAITHRWPEGKLFLTVRNLF